MIEMFQDRPNPGYPAFRSRAQEDPQRASEGQLQYFGPQSPNSFIEDHHGVWNL
jgi:hypothetical protein